MDTSHTAISPKPLDPKKNVRMDTSHTATRPQEESKNGYVTTTTHQEESKNGHVTATRPQEKSKNGHVTVTSLLTVGLSSHVQVQCCFTSTETIRTIRDREPRTATSTFTQRMRSMSSHPRMSLS